MSSVGITLRLVRAACLFAGSVAATASCAEVLGYERADLLEAGASSIPADGGLTADARPLDPTLACAGDPPPAVNPNVMVVQRAHLLDVSTNASVVNLRIRTCARVDVGCDSPKEGPDGSFSPTPDGFLETRVEYGFNGYFEFTNPRYVTTLLFVSPPAVADATGTQVQLLTPKLFDALARSATGDATPLDPALGHAFVHIEDCLGQSRSGVHIKPINQVAGKTWPYYIYDLLPDTNGTETDTSGNTGIINLPPGLVTVDGFFADGRRYGSATFIVRPGVLSYVAISPKQ